MEEGEEEEGLVTPGEFLGESTLLVAGRGAYLAPDGRKIYASLAGRRCVTPPVHGSAEPVGSPSSCSLDSPASSPLMGFPVFPAEGDGRSGRAQGPRRRSETGLHRRR